jgi:hypothetical protein
VQSVQFSDSFQDSCGENGYLVDIGGVGGLQIEIRNLTHPGTNNHGNNIT